jgi:hypothetical protein
VGGGGMGGPGRLGEEGKVGVQAGDDLLQNFIFRHGSSVLSVNG